MKTLVAAIVLFALFGGIHPARSEGCMTQEATMDVLTRAAEKLGAEIRNEVYRGETAVRAKDILRAMTQAEYDFDAKELIVFRISKMGQEIAIAAWFNSDGCGVFAMDGIPSEVINDILLKSGVSSTRN